MESAKVKQMKGSGNLGMGVSLSHFLFKAGEI